VVSDVGDVSSAVVSAVLFAVVVVGLVAPLGSVGPDDIVGSVDVGLVVVSASVAAEDPASPQAAASKTSGNRQSTRG